MKDILENLLFDVTEQLEEHFETEEVSADTLRLHLNYSLLNTLIKMVGTNSEFFINDETFEFIESEFGIDLESEWPKFNRASKLTIKQVFEEQFTMDLFFLALKAAESDYEYPVEHWVSHIILRPNECCCYKSLQDDDYLLSVYQSAIHECKAWMIYDDSKIAEIELFAANLVTLEC